MRRLLTTLAVACAASALAAVPASASHGQADYFDAGRLLLAPLHEAATFAKLKSLGVRALRIELPWADVAPRPTSAGRPRFAATDPASYAWGVYPGVIAHAKELGWQVLLTVTAPAPRWATSNRRHPYITRPSDSDFEQFMTAVGREFSTTVTLYSIWNEPNHPAFLLPQWNRNGTPASPGIYRGLYEAGYAGLRRAGMKHPRVLFGETAPVGFDHVSPAREGTLHAVAPLAFLRSAFCLNSHYRPAGSCAELHMSGFALHPYTKAVGPSWVPPQADDVTIGSLARLTSALERAAAARAVPRGVPLYLTEYGVQSYPNLRLGVPVDTQAVYDAVAERIAWDNSRVAGFSQYLLEDDPLGGAPGSSARGGTVGFQTGLEYSNGAHKPSYDGWRLPLTVSRRSGGFSLWGLVRPANGATHLTLLARRAGSARFAAIATVRTNAGGYWTLHTSTPYAQWRVRWRSPSGSNYQGAAIGVY